MLNRLPKAFHTLMLSVPLLLLAACDDNRREPASAELSGVVAVGAPVTGAQVELHCVGHSVSTVTDLTGSWQIDIPQNTTPCLIKASGGTPSVTLYSYAEQAGQINITPLTTFSVARAAGLDTLAALDAWFASANPNASGFGTAVSASKQQLVTTLRDAGYNVPADFEPFTGTFQAVTGDAHDDLLEAIAAVLDRDQMDYDGFLDNWVNDQSVPSAQPSYQIGGSISGLDGTLVLQNNGGHDLTRSGNGSFSFAAVISAGSNYNVTVKTQPTGQNCTVNHGSGTANADVTSISITCIDIPPQTYTIGGSISGLSGTLILQNNGGDTLTRSSNGSFSFGSALNAGSSYNVTVQTQPTGQICTVANGSGTANANIGTVSVTCIISTYTIGGSISGLTGTLVLQNNGGDTLTRTGDGSFSFATAINAGTAYNVTIQTQPDGQSCTVANGGGTANTNVGSISITCATNTYTVGGSITGLTGTLVLQNHGGDPLTRSSNGSFTFGTAVAAGSTYDVTVQTQPSGQSCTVANGSGTANANVGNISVSCVEAQAQSYSIGGNVGGLGSTLVLQNNGGETLVRHAGGNFTFPTKIAAGGTYNVTVLTQPMGQVCTIVNGTGTANADVTNIQVTCIIPQPPLDLSSYPECVNPAVGPTSLLDGRNGIAALFNGTACVSTDATNVGGWPLWLGSTNIEAGDSSKPFSIAIRQLSTTVGTKQNCNINGVVSLFIKLGSHDFNGSPREEVSVVGCEIIITEAQGHVLAGTFSGTLYNPVTEETLNVTNGEFRFAKPPFAAGNDKPLVMASFEGLPTGNLGGKQDASGDFGWESGPWRGPDSVPSVVDTAASPLSVTLGGKTLDGGSRAIQILNTGGLQRDELRHFEHGFSGELYASTLLRIDADQIGTSSTSLNFGNTAWSFGIDSSDAQNMFFAQLPGNGNVARFGGVLEPRRTYLLVARLHKANGADVYNRLDVWLDPNPSNPTSPDATLTLPNDSATGTRRIIDRIGFYINQNQNRNLQLDRLVFSDTWAGIFDTDGGDVGTGPELSGTLDSSFNSSGYLLDDWQPNSISVLPRINANGSFTIIGATPSDPKPMLATFSSSGVRSSVVAVDTGGRGVAAAVPVGDDKIVLGLYSSSAGGGSSAGYLKRVNADGSLDTSFASSGTFTDSDFLFQSSEMTLATDAHDRILVTSFAKGLMRFTASGALDTSFGTDGIAALPADHGEFESFWSQVVASDGAYYVLTGAAGGAAKRILRITEGGALDSGFGSGGHLDLPVNSRQNTIVAMPNGGVLALTGCNANTNQANCKLIHYSNTGGVVAEAVINEVPAGASTQSGLTRGAVLKRLNDGRILLSAHWGGTVPAPIYLAEGQLFGLFNADLTPVTSFDGGGNGLIVYPSTAMGSTPGIGFAFNTVMPSVHALDVDAQGRILFVGQAMDASFSQRWAAVRLGSGAP